MIVEAGFLNKKIKGQKTNKNIFFLKVTYLMNEYIGVLFICIYLRNQTHHDNCHLICFHTNPAGYHML